MRGKWAKSDRAGFDSGTCRIRKGLQGKHRGQTQRQREREGESPHLRAKYRFLTPLRTEEAVPLLARYLKRDRRIRAAGPCRTVEGDTHVG